MDVHLKKNLSVVFHILGVGRLNNNTGDISGCEHLLSAMRNCVIHDREVIIFGK